MNKLDLKIIDSFIDYKRRQAKILNTTLESIVIETLPRQGVQIGEYFYSLGDIKQAIMPTLKERAFRLGIDLNQWGDEKGKI